jgi:hypothetical protein
MRILLRLAAVMALAPLAGSAFAQCSPPMSLTGSWKGNDGGTYYVQQNGATVWWVGMSGDKGRSWTNVFQGSLSGSILTGTWSDVPFGGTKNNGSITLTLSRTTGGGIVGMKRVAVSGGFSGSSWSLNCNDVILNPQP